MKSCSWTELSPPSAPVPATEFGLLREYFPKGSDLGTCSEE